MVTIAATKPTPALVSGAQRIREARPPLSCPASRVSASTISSKVVENGTAMALPARREPTVANMDCMDRMLPTSDADSSVKTKPL